MVAARLHEDEVPVPDLFGVQALGLRVGLQVAGAQTAAGPVPPGSQPAPGETHDHVFEAAGQPPDAHLAAEREGLRLQQLHEDTVLSIDEGASGREVQRGGRLEPSAGDRTLKAQRGQVGHAHHCLLQQRGRGVLGQRQH